MQAPNKQRGKGVRKLPQQSADHPDQPAKTTTLSLPSDADIAALQTPESRQLSMYERLVYGGRMDKPRTYENAHTNSAWTVGLMCPNGPHELRWWMERKVRRIAEDTWDYTQDT